MLTSTERKRVEQAVKAIEKMASENKTYFDVTLKLLDMGFTRAEIRLAFDMWHWNSRTIH